MMMLLITLLFGQYNDVYVPHKSFDVESGALIGTASSEIALSIRSFSQSSDISSPVFMSFSHSFDGRNEIGLGLPWLKVVGDSANHIFIGNTEAYYKRRIIGSLRWGYLAAKLTAEIPTSPDTLDVGETLGGNYSHYTLALAYSYELPLLTKHHDFFGVLPLIGTVALEDRFLDWNHDSGSGEFGASLGWSAALEILPVDYAFVGAFIKGGNDEVIYGPYLGFRWYWFDVGASWRMGATDRFDFHLRFYI